MISINKQGNAIVIEFTDNDKYLFNGTIEVAPNELMIVIDESNMATFKRSTNGDTLFSQLINKIQIGGTNVTKDTILDEFAKIGFTTGSGGSGGAVNSVNGQTGDVVITASNVGAYSKNEVDNLLNSKQGVFQVDAPMAFNGDHLSINLTDYATKADISGKADSTTVEAISTEVTTNSTNITNLTNKVNEDSERITTLNTEIAGKQAKLIAGQNIELSAPDESGNVTISASGEVSVDWSEITGKPTNFSDWNATEGEQVIANKPDLSQYTTNVKLNQVLSDYATNVELNHLKSDSAHKADISSLNGKVDKVEGKSLISDSEITRLATLTNYDDTEVKNLIATKANSADVYTKTESDAKYLTEHQSLADYATKEELSLKANSSDIPTKTSQLVNDSGYLTEHQSLANYATKSEIPTLISQLTNDSGYITSIPSEYVTETELESKGYLTEHQSLENYALKTEIPDISGLATKSEIPTATSQLTNDSGFITEIPSEYITETELTSSLSTKADSANVYTKAEIDNMIGEISARLDQINGEVI